MVVDLVALRRKADALYGPEADEYFWAGVRELAPTDLLAYGLYVHGYSVPILAKLALSRHAYAMAATMERHRKTQRITPPEHGKTSLSRWKVEQWLGQQTELAFKGEAPAPSALYVMNTAEQAQKQCMDIAATLESNPRYKELYPNVASHSALGWTKDTLFLQRPSPRPDPSLLATGIFGPYQGYRFGLEMVDDPTDQEDAMSDLTMQKQRERFAGTLLDRLVDGGECHLSSTRWGKKDIPEMILRNPEWVSEVMPCYGYWATQSDYLELWPNGVPKELWPEMWPETRLEAKRRDKELTENSGLWQLAYLCSPVLAEGQMFRRNWLKYANPPIDQRPQLELVA